jgi:hypothetical protein
MSITPIVALAIAIVTLPAGAAPALRATAKPAVADTRITRATRAVAPRDSLHLAAALAQAERFAVAGRGGDARRLYREVVAEQVAAGESASRTHWLIATTLFAEGRDLATARALDEAAQSAAEFGDPEMELRATFEAAVLYASVHMPDLVSSRMSRVRRLLKSPAVRPEVRSSIERRIGPR